MRAVARRALEDRLDEYLHLVQEGETILVTEHDRVIVELVPPREIHDLPAANPALDDAIRRGWITPAARAGEPAPPLPPPVVPLEDDPGDLLSARVIRDYLDERISLGKAAELLHLSRFELEESLQRLGLPLRRGPRSIEDAQAEIAAARRHA